MYKISLLISIAVVGLVGASGCGDSEEPSGAGPAVAIVRGVAIPRAEFERHVRARLRAVAEGPPAGAQRRLWGKVVLQQLIQNEWLEQEAARQHVKASPRAVRRWYAETRRAGQRATAAGGDSGSYDATMQAAQGAEDARRSEGRAVILRPKLVRRIMARQAPPDGRLLRQYYEAHKADFASGEIRYLRFILTKRASRAREARRELERGVSWREVSRRFSLDDAFLRHPNGQIGAGRGELTEPLGRAVFSASVGSLHGPIETSAGVYIFELVRILPARQLPFEEARRGVEMQVKSRQFDRAAGRLVAGLGARYKESTRCAKGLVVPLCGGVLRGSSDDEGS